MSRCFFNHRILALQRPNLKKTWCMGPYAGVEYNLTLCRLQNRLQHMHHGQPYAESTLNLCHSRLYPPIQKLQIWPRYISSNWCYRIGALPQWEQTIWSSVSKLFTTMDFIKPKKTVNNVNFQLSCGLYLWLVTQLGQTKDTGHTWAQHTWSTEASTSPGNVVDGGIMFIDLYVEARRLM